MRWCFSPRQAPTAEQLAAYADRELKPAARRRVEQWLQSHPQVRAEIHAQRAIDRLLQATGAPDPSEIAWARARSRALARASQRFQWAWSGWLPRGRAASLSAVAAAGLVFALTLGRPDEEAAELRGPYPVATAADVEVVALDAADVPALVVGESPLAEALVAVDREAMEPENLQLHIAGPEVPAIPEQKRNFLHRTDPGFMIEAPTGAATARPRPAR